MNELIAGRRIRRIDMQKYTFFNSRKFFENIFRGVNCELRKSFFRAFQDSSCQRNDILIITHK